MLFKLLNCPAKQLKEEDIMWIRFLMIGLFSLTASSLFFYQGMEMYHAFTDFFRQK